MAIRVVKFSAPVTSVVRPPERSCFCQSGLFVVRSGLMTLQVSPAVRALVDVLAAEVDRIGLERVDGDRGVPVEAQLVLGFGSRGPDVLALAGPQIPADQVALLAHGVAAHGIARVGNGVEAVAEIHLLPVLVADAAVLPDRRSGPSRSRCPAGRRRRCRARPVSYAHVVELRQRQVRDEAPGARRGRGSRRRRRRCRRSDGSGRAGSIHMAWWSGWTARNEASGWNVLPPSVETVSVVASR